MIKKSDLKKVLNYYDNLYYNNDISEITDEEYNELKTFYVKNYGEYKYVPGKASKLKKHFKHTTNVNSLDKVKITERDKLIDNLNRLWPVIFQPKFDGLTIVIYKVEGGFLAVTRGNGIEGEQVNDSFLKVDGIGEALDDPVRVEVLLPKEEFNRINEERDKQGLEPYDSARNAAAGMIRQLKKSDVKGLKCFAYNILYSEENNNNLEQLSLLKDAGWNITDYYIPESIEDALNYIDNFDRDSLPYEIDGLVIKHNGSKKFGSVVHHPLGAIAVKFESKGAWTEIEDIELTVGRTGKITPVAKVKPIVIDNITIKQATLHNYTIQCTHGLDKIVFDKDKNPLTKVHVIRSNDVIPAIDDCIQPEFSSITYSNIVNSFSEPKECPVCHEPLKSENGVQYCTNFYCNSKASLRLTHMAQKNAFNIENLSIKTAEKIIELLKSNLKKVLCQIDNTIECGEFDEETFEYRDICENLLESLHPSLVYTLTLDEINSIEGFGYLSATKLYNQIQKSKELTFDRFLYGCGIPLVGEKTAKDIAVFYSAMGEKALDNFILDYYDGFSKLITLKNVGDETVKSIYENYKKMIEPFGDYNLIIKNVEVPKIAENQLTFVITGEFDTKRSEIKKLIESKGHKVSGSVSKKTDYLLAAPGEESTNKYKTAIEIGTKIIKSLDELNILI